MVRYPLAVLVVLSLAVPALAAEGTTPSAEGAPPAAQATPAPPAATTPAPASTGIKNPWFVHLNVGVPLYTSVGAWTNPSGGQVKAQSFTPAQRFALVELVGFGRWVHPNVRLNLSLQFAELLSGQTVAQPAGATTYTGLAFAGAIAWVAFNYGPAFVGVGPMMGARTLGTSAQSWTYVDAGIFSCVGASLKLGQGFLLGLAVQFPVTFNPAVVFSVVPAAFVARRF